MTWYPMETAPQDRRVLLQLGDSHDAIVVVGEYIDGFWLLCGNVLLDVVAWQEAPALHCFTCGGPCVFLDGTDMDTRVGEATITIAPLERSAPCGFCGRLVDAGSVHRCVRRVEP